MTIIAAYYYNEGKRVREIRLDEHVELNENRSGFCWIALSEPTADELSAIQTTYNLHPLAIDNAMHPLCPPKLEVYNDELYVVAQTAELVGDRISYGKMAIFTGHNHLIRGGKREPQKIPPFRIVEFFGGVVRGMTTRQRLPHLSEALWRDAETPGNSATPVPGPQ